MKKWRALFEKSKHFLLVSFLILITFCYAMFQGGFVSWFVFFTVSPFLLYAFKSALLEAREEASVTVDGSVHL
ncbi:hypothetical protein LSPH24S_02169 [Lysinibacillus sphaericus]